jgi:hypothetical protein
MRSVAVTTRGPSGEPYPDFQKRAAEDAKRVMTKISVLDRHIAHCPHCGETVGPEDAGIPCKVNNTPMASTWARERAKKEFYQLSNFGGEWTSAVEALACLLDRIWAEGRSGK